MYGHGGDMKMSRGVFQRVQRQLDMKPSEHMYSLIKHDCPPKIRRARVHATSSQRFAFSQSRLGHSLFPLPLYPISKRGSVCPTISLFYSPLKPLHFPFNHHESQCLEPAPICHLIIVRRCRDPPMLRCLSESCSTFPNLLGNGIGKCQRHFRGPGEC